MDELQKIAEAAVAEAAANPGQWVGVPGRDDAVLFANGVFTVGDNGDYTDCDNAESAARTLYNHWSGQIGIYSDWQ